MKLCLYSRSNEFESLFPDLKADLIVKLENILFKEICDWKDISKAKKRTTKTLIWNEQGGKSNIRNFKGKTPKMFDKKT